MSLIKIHQTHTANLAAFVSHLKSESEAAFSDVQQGYEIEKMERDIRKSENRIVRLISGSSRGGKSIIKSLEKRRDDAAVLVKKWQAIERYLRTGAGDVYLDDAEFTALFEFEASSK